MASIDPGSSLLITDRRFAMLENQLLFIILSEIAIAVSLAIALFMESSSWSVKALAPQDRVGLFISRANIYLYSARFFVLIFSSGLAFYIERNQPASDVAILISASLALAAILQLVLLTNNPIGRKVVRLIARCLFLDISAAPLKERRHTGELGLTYLTAMTAFVFGVGAGAPLLLASLLPDYRLSISYTGQIINSFGMLLLLFVVDQRLYKYMDQGNLHAYIDEFTWGRAWGFMLAALMFLFAWAVI